MVDAIKKDNARYADFAARLTAELAKEEDRIARFVPALYVAADADNTAATIRPTHRS